jgi:hypothetical protein
MAEASIHDVLFTQFISHWQGRGASVHVFQTIYPRRIPVSSTVEETLAETIYELRMESS